MNKDDDAYIHTQVPLSLRVQFNKFVRHGLRGEVLKSLLEIAVEDMETRGQKVVWEILNKTWRMGGCE